jgi:hypothetical protein
MWNRNARMLAPALTAVLLVPCWGCSIGSGQQLPSLLPVKGKVTYKGQPVTKGTVRFEPEGFGRMARGELQSDGTYVLTTSKDGDGVVAGAHRVSIGGFDKSLAKNRALQKYTSPNTSRLTADVDGEHTVFNFDL